MKYCIPHLLCCLLTTPLSAQRLLPIGSGADLFGINDILVQGDQLIVGGLFSSFNGHLRRNLQGWDGTQHFDMPGAFENGSERVSALELFNGELVAGGNDADFNYVASWNGSTWSALGDGLTRQPLDIALYMDGLCAGGQDSAVSYYDGAAWSVLGTFNGRVAALAVHQGILYAGGDFTATGDELTALNGLARYSGSDWEQVGTGLNGAVNDLVSTPNGLVIGGQFTGNNGTQPFPHWVIFNSGEFEIPTFDPGAPVTGTVAMPSGGFLLASTGGSTWLLQGDELPVRMGDIKAAAFHNGQVVVAGLGSNAEYPQTLNKIARLVPGTSTDVLDVGGIRATAFADPHLFHRKAANRAGFEAPKDSVMYSIYSAQLWARGSANGVDHYAFPYEIEESDVVNYGPMADSYDALFDDRYCQVWKLDRQMIWDHVQNHDEPLYDMPWDIATWPGNGQVDNGEPAQLAPYMDLDADGTYEPGDGEYPLFRGDQAIYYIYHTLPGPGLPGLPFDVHVMHYAYGDANDVDRYNTVYTNQRIVNRGTDTFTDLRAGIYADFDIGNYQDDRLACDSALSLSYAYNGDDFDEVALEQVGYGDRPAAQGVLLLSEPMTAHGTVIAPFGVDRLNDALDGTFNGEPFSGSGISTHFLYPGAPLTDEATGNSAGDRNGLASVGPHSLAPGDTLCLDLAFVFARASGGPQASVDLLRQRTVALRAAYATDALACEVPNDFNVHLPQESTPARWSLSPVPAKDIVFLDGPAAQVSVLDGTGRMLLQQQRTTTGSTALDVSTLPAGVYLVRLNADRMESTLRMVKVE